MKMKRWLVYLLAPLIGIGAAACVIITMSACATTQVVQLTPDQVILQEILEVEGAKDDLFTRCMEWMARTFTSSEEVIEYQDKDAGMIIGKGYVVATGKPYRTLLTAYILTVNSAANEVYLKFTITVEVKENRVRVTLDQIRYTVDVEKNEPLVDNQEMFDAAKPDLEGIIESLKNHLTQEPEDW